MRWWEWLMAQVRVNGKVVKLKKCSFILCNVNCKIRCWHSWGNPWTKNWKIIEGWLWWTAYRMLFSYIYLVSMSNCCQPFYSLESLNKKSKFRSYLTKLASFQIRSKMVPVNKPVSIKLLRNRCFSTGIHEYFTLNPMYTRSRMRTTYSIQSTAPYIPSSFIINKTVFINFTTFYLGTSNTR